MRRRRGFILLFGTRPIISQDRHADPLNTVCPRCGQRADIIGKTYRQWFTIFFIPLFPVSGTKRFSQCSQCGAQFPIETRALSTYISAADGQQSQRAIAMYNSLRNSPANAVTLNELMALYASISEHDQAISAAREFPDALNSSEQCMTTLGRVYLAKNDHATAQQWFDAALARNDALGEAHYYKGVAKLTADPPDFDAAIAAARSARSARYPGAQSLLEEAETRARAAAR